MLRTALLCCLLAAPGYARSLQATCPEVVEINGAMHTCDDANDNYGMDCVFLEVVRGIDCGGCDCVVDGVESGTMWSMQVYDETCNSTRPLWHVGDVLVAEDFGGDIFEDNLPAVFANDVCSDLFIWNGKNVSVRGRCSNGEVWAQWFDGAGCDADSLYDEEANDRHWIGAMPWVDEECVVVEWRRSGVATLSEGLQFECVATPAPTVSPTPRPSAPPTSLPTPVPSLSRPPTALPTSVPTATPSEVPTTKPTKVPTTPPSPAPSDLPTTATPTGVPTAAPSVLPTTPPSNLPSVPPTSLPSHLPTTPLPSVPPTLQPTPGPTITGAPTGIPTPVPSPDPTTASPTTAAPSATPSTAVPSPQPSAAPSPAPSTTFTPTLQPISSAPSSVPSFAPTPQPSTSHVPTSAPSARPPRKERPAWTAAVPLWAVISVAALVVAACLGYGLVYTLRRYEARVVDRIKRDVEDKMLSPPQAGTPRRRPQYDDEAMRTLPMPLAPTALRTPMRPPGYDAYSRATRSNGGHYAYSRALPHTPQSMRSARVAPYYSRASPATPQSSRSARVAPYTPLSRRSSKVPPTTPSSPLETEIAELRSRLEAVERPITAEVADLRARLDFVERFSPLSVADGADRPHRADASPYASVMSRTRASHINADYGSPSGRRLDDAFASADRPAPSWQDAPPGSRFSYSHGRRPRRGRRTDAPIKPSGITNPLGDAPVPAADESSVRTPDFRMPAADEFSVRTEDM